ncbi:MAG: hypothetical protein A3F46_03105 [Legionellales bacterium RIFCSPHIGHO2_12_FULL_42_9]|nr:MAG: hypothetical protein A3F46_03105 [Legionellales bacterium RIFCSPHIGHO2_12_FULL_42_9]
MDRDDLSRNLTHWMSGTTKDEAFDHLYEIIYSRTLRGSNIFIKGNYRCICFTETPPKHFKCPNRKYQPFGIMYPKEQIFLMGGRPVIYQPEQEFFELPEKIRWRHMRYDLGAESSVDFTWEREWRLHENELLLEPDSTTVLVPNEEWAEELINRFDNDENIRYQEECVGYCESLARWPEKFPFEIQLLNKFK